MNKAEQALQLAEKITKLRVELKDLEAQFYALFGEQPAYVFGVGTISAAATTVAEPTSVAGKIKALLYGNPGKALGVDDFLEVIPDTNQRTVRATAGRLIKTTKGQIVSAGRGKYKYVGTGSIFS